MIHDAAPPPVGAIDHRAVAWPRVRRARYFVEQRFTYAYPGPIRNLRQCLMVVPPEHHGDQRLLDYHVDVTAPPEGREEASDPFGNHLFRLSVACVERCIDFVAAITLERTAGLPAPTVPVALAARYLAPTELTQPDARLEAAARSLVGCIDGGSTEELASRITAWVYATFRYTKEVTTIRTAAAEAFQQRAGVCQDAAHVMLALCRLCDIPARYVSGHLLGEGATHAWVEALVPAAGRPDVLVARAFDPTHGRRAGLNYITVATGRDYRDVAPTSGTFDAPYGGTLTSSKRATVTAIEYDDAEADDAQDADAA